MRHSLRNVALLQEFFLAVDRRDYATLKRCLENGLDPNSTDKVGRTSLHLSALNGDVELCRIVLAVPGVNVNQRTWNLDFTPLHWAVFHNRIAIVHLLISNGAEINALNRNKQSCLHFATSTGNLELVTLLLENHADVNAIDVFDHTPLSQAVLDSRHFAIAGMLLECGASPLLHRPYSLPLFHETVLNCTELDKLPFLALLHDYGGDSSEIDVTGKNAWHYAALNGWTMTGVFLHYIKCPDDVPDYMERTPYDLAMQHQNYNIASLLLKYREARKKSSLVAPSETKLNVFTVTDLLDLINEK